MAAPVVSCRSELWAAATKQESKVQEMVFLIWIKRYTKLLNKVDIKEKLRVFNLNGRIKRIISDEGKNI